LKHLGERKSDTPLHEKETAERGNPLEFLSSGFSAGPFFDQAHEVVLFGGSDTNPCQSPRQEHLGRLTILEREGKAVPLLAYRCIYPSLHIKLGQLHGRRETMLNHAGTGTEFQQFECEIFPLRLCIEYRHARALYGCLYCVYSIIPMRLGFMNMVEACQPSEEADESHLP
jgi:hypothetical protein